MKIVFVKLFRLNVREGGMYKPSIISYIKQDFIQRDDVVVGWKHHLYLNLWLIELYIDWQTGEKLTRPVSRFKVVKENLKIKLPPFKRAES